MNVHSCHIQEFQSSFLMAAHGGADVTQYFVVFWLMMTVVIVGHRCQQKIRVDSLLIACISNLWQIETRPQVHES